MEYYYLSFVKVVRYAITVICKAKKKNECFTLTKTKRSIDLLFLFWRHKLLRLTRNEALFPFDFPKSFLITYLITIAFLQCKIYSIVRRHRFQNTLPASAKKGTNSWWNENDVWASSTICAQRIPHLAPYTFDLLFAKDIHWICYDRREVWRNIFDNLARIYDNTCVCKLLFEPVDLISCWRLRHIRCTMRISLRNVLFSGIIQAVETVSWKEEN